MSLKRKEIIAQKLLLRGKIKKVLSCAHMYSLEQRARNPHDQNEQTLTEDFVVMTNKLNFEFLGANSSRHEIILSYNFEI